MKRIIFRCFFMVFFCLLLAGCVNSVVTEKPFSESPKKLVDPDLVCGVLPNGFQYVLMENQTPDNRVSMHLNVFTGSAYETDQEQGIAHYLEHMLFNGSTHFKPGELIEFFQSIGMGFGADANASTSYFRTIYDLNLPKGDNEHLQDALLVFQDYAYGALILEEEVNRERGIILAEKLDRDSVSYQMLKKKLNFEIPGSLLNKRHPIGLEKIIKQTDSNLLRQFYNKWYRPDNMMLVAVGDFNSKNLESMIKTKFSNFPSTDVAFKNKKTFQPNIAWKPHKPGIHPFYLHDPEAQTTSISIERITYRPFVHETVEDLKVSLLEDMANQIMSHRLVEKIRSQQSIFSSGGAFSGQFLQNLYIAGIEAKFLDPNQWQSGVEELEHLLRQALEYGFTKGELERVKANISADIEADAKQASTRKTNSIAQDILSSVNSKKMFLSPAQIKELLIPFVKELNLEQLNKAFRQIWKDDHRLILVTGNVKISENEKLSEVQQIRSAYDIASKKSLKPLANSTVNKFPYLPVPDSSAQNPLANIVRQEKNINNTGITTIDFENNTRLAVKYNNFQKKQFIFSLVVGNGLGGQPSNMPGLAFLAADTLNQSGFGSMNTNELEKALAGHNVSINFAVEEDFFCLNGSGDSEELELAFQLIYTFLKDPGFSSEALALAKTRYENYYKNKYVTTNGLYQIEGAKFLAGGDSRFGLPDPAIIKAYSLDDVRKFLEDTIKNDCVELSVVGDVEQDEVIKYSKTYLGGLGERKPLEKLKKSFVNFPQGKNLDLVLGTRIEKEMIRLCFSTDDYWDIKKNRRLDMLARIFSERLRKIVREDKAAAYSPYAYNDPSQLFDGYGLFQAVTTVNPGETDSILEVFEDIARDLHDNGTSQKEVDLVLKSVIEHLKIAYKTNRFWLNSVLKGSLRFPEKFEWPVNIMEDYESIGADQLSDLAREYLDPVKAVKIKITRKEF